MRLPLAKPHSRRYEGTSPVGALSGERLWAVRREQHPVDEYYFLNQPGQADIQLNLFYDYQNNVKTGSHTFER